MRLKAFLLLAFFIHFFFFKNFVRAENLVCPPCPLCSSPTVVPTPTIVPTPVSTPSPAPTSIPATNSQGDDDSCQGLNLKTWAQDAKGWTLFPPAAKTIFVSSAGLVPLGAPSNSLAARTLQDGLNLLEKGKHQALLLKRGETFAGVSLDAKLGGLDSDHLMVIGAYGEGARPKLVFKGAVGLVASNAGSNVAFVDLDLDGYQSSAHGIRLVQSSGSNILLEGVRIAGFTNGITADFQSATAAAVFQNLIIRRSVIVDSFARTPAAGQPVGHSQGVYLSKAAGVLFEEDVFDHNGWKNLGNGDADRAQGGSGSPTVFNHNGYIQSENSCVTFRKNVVLRGAATGWQMRAGGVVEENFFALNPMQLTFGSVNGGSVQAAHILPGISGHISNNVFIWGTDLSPKTLRDGSSELGNIRHGVMENNIIAHHLRGASAGFGVNLRGAQNGIGIHNFLVQNNTIYDVATKVLFQGSAWGPVNLKAENLTGPDETGKVVTRSLASVFLPNGTRVTDGLSSGISGRYAPMAIADAGTVLSGNILQTGATDFLTMPLPPKSSVLMKNMQTAAVQFVDPNRKLDNSYFDQVRKLERANWDASRLAPTMNAWVRAGFQKK